MEKTEISPGEIESPSGWNFECFSVYGQRTWNSFGQGQFAEFRAECEADNAAGRVGHFSGKDGFSIPQGTGVDTGETGGGGTDSRHGCVPLEERSRTPCMAIGASVDAAFHGCGKRVVQMWAPVLKSCADGVCVSCEAAGF